MEFITVHNTKIPALGYGTWQLDAETTLPGVLRALEIGYRHIDTAQVYGNEWGVGAAIEESTVPRSDIFLTTKIWMDKVRPGDLQTSARESLDRLRTDYVDMLLIHWPVSDVPLKDQLDALHEVKESGLTRLIGVSNFPVALMREVEATGFEISNNQVEYHPYLSQAPVLDYVRAHDMFLTAYSPIARGKILDNRELQEIAAKYDKSVAQVALRWLIQQERVAAIPKAAKEEHARSNFEIFDFKLSDDEMQRIFALAKPDGRTVNPAWAPQWDRAAA